MLVVSRRPDESIVFPNVGITVKILRVDRKVARIGIEAPKDVRILRHEVSDDFEDFNIDSSLIRQDQTTSRQELHEIRNRLNSVNLGLHLYRHQAEAGMHNEAQVTFHKVLDELDKIDRKIAPLGAAKGKESAPDSAIKLLLVEDDSTQRELLAGLLEMRGCHVATATDGEDAMDYLSANEWPDFMLLDMKMPRCDGPQTVKRVREASLSPKLKIFAITGSAPEEFGIETGPQGVDHWIPKPLNPEGLIEMMTQRAKQITGSPVTA